MMIHPIEKLFNSGGKVHSSAITATLETEKRITWKDNV
jgi:hypothetical protein